MTDTFSAQTSISIEAPIERVWEALVNPEIVALYLHGTTLEARAPAKSLRVGVARGFVGFVGVS